VAKGTGLAKNEGRPHQIDVKKSGDNSVKNKKLFEQSEFFLFSYRLQLLGDFMQP